MDNHQFGMTVVKFLHFPDLTFVRVILGKGANSELAVFSTLEVVSILTELMSRNSLKDGQQLGRRSLIKDGKHKIGQEISCLKTLLTW